MTKKKSKKNTGVSLTQVRGILKQVVFNPRSPGPMKIIADQGSPEYYELRAIEEIHMARSIRTYYYTTGGYAIHILKAIQLLILAQLYGPDQR